MRRRRRHPQNIYHRGIGINLRFRISKDTGDRETLQHCLMELFMRHPSIFRMDARWRGVKFLEMRQISPGWRVERYRYAVKWDADFLEVTRFCYYRRR
ncbi:hypothetical protein [Candidatus Williamhamiltonella defendens]|uniref:hypothetical protein n=1 Tax=Candidatus Williamhamiltonella defendens TaxID=138072 RepID=UPI001C9D9DAD|nr:hypothetical protein [Candidatus Hamiltonella defensa]